MNGTFLSFFRILVFRKMFMSLYEFVYLGARRFDSVDLWDSDYLAEEAYFKLFGWSEVDDLYCSWFTQNVSFATMFHTYLWCLRHFCSFYCVKISCKKLNSKIILRLRYSCVINWEKTWMTFVFDSCCQGSG